MERRKFFAALVGGIVALCGIKAAKAAPPKMLWVQVPIPKKEMREAIEGKRIDEAKFTAGKSTQRIEIGEPYEEYFSLQEIQKAELLMHRLLNDPEVLSATGHIPASQLRILCARVSRMVVKSRS